MKSLTYIEIDVPAFEGGSPPDIITWRFAMPTDYLPPEIEAISSIASVSITPATISLGKDLGLRANINVSFIDHKHVFNGEPFNQGTFWGKWRGRYGEKLRGRPFRLIRGLLGQPLESMEVRHFIIDATDGPTPDGVYTITAKDVLKLADNDRAQAPQLSNGSLAGSIDDSTTSATLNPAGIGDLEYPASGWVCIGGKEVCAFTRSADALTITRGQFGSIAQGHDAGDRVQLVLRYTGNDPADIIADLLENYAGVPSAYIPLSEWQAETSEYLGVIYARTITEPSSVNKLVAELVEQAALAVYWDDLAQLLRLRVLREISTDAETFDHSRLIEGSLSVKSQPNERISQIWSYYGQRDPTDQSDNADNYRAALATVDLERETEYGSAEIRKVLAGWVETETAATRLNSIQLSRFRDPPRRFEFSLFRDVSITPAAGYQLRWWGNQNALGEEVPVPIQVTRVRVEADMIHVEAEEMLASGVIVLVNVVFLLTTGSVLQWEVPATWNDVDNSVHVIGAGGGGASRQGDAGGKGGGGGAYSRVTNISLTPAAMIDYRVGAAGVGGVASGDGTDGGNTWFGAATFGAATVAAEGGQGGTDRAGDGQGGQASNGIGDSKFSGGDGGSGGFSDDNPTGGGGGGGAAGPNGNGADGTQPGTDDSGGGGGGGADGGLPGGDVVGTTGGDGGDNRFGFGGGDSGSPSGQEGGGGRGGDSFQSGSPGGDGEQIWTQTISPIISAGPGAGGGAGGRQANGGGGGDYGGGGGGAGGRVDAAGGDGAQGIIVIRWREV